ncbi:MAG: hypothetical protein ACLTBX_01640 [Clostridia bacterium]
MTIEELEIIVSVKIAEAIKEFKKIVPAIKQTVQKAQESFEKMDTTKMKKNVNQAVQYVKKKMQDLRKSNENNQIKLKVNNKDAQKQISQIQKQIDSLNEKINSRQMKLNTITPRLDEITAQTTRDITPQGVSPDNPAIQNTVNNSLSSNKEYTSLLAQESKMTQEIAMYNNQLTIAKNKMAQLKSETNNTATSQNKLTSFFKGFGSKIKQAVSNSKGISNNLKELPKITNKINFNGLNKGMKRGLGHVFRYAGALLSLESIYGLLSSSANAWLNSQNAGAQQLNANIEYMRYAMGSALAPVIQFVTNLVYQLMKAVQSVVYALTGVNIFANAGAKAYSNMANGAKKATKESKQLAGVHDEINNIQGTNPEGGGSGAGSVTPNFDLSEVEGITSSIIDAVKNGNWYEVGEILGNKLNDAMNNIGWGKIQSTARNIGTQIAKFLNGFIATTNWNQVGNTFAQGLNTAIYFGYSFVTTFDWKQFGIAIGDSINGFLNNIDWATAGQTLSEGIKGILNTITQTLLTIDWSGIGQNIVTFMTNIDWQGIVSSLCSAVGSALGGASALIASILLEAIIYPLSDYFLEKTEEAGGNIVLGILKGIVDGLIGIGEWIYNNMIYPFVSAFCEALGIHSPSTVFQEFGKNIIQGLFNGIQSLVDTITQIWNNMKNIASNIWNSITTTISNIINGIKNTIQNVLNTISSIWSNIWNGMKNTVTNIFNGIWNTIRNIINSILGGIEGMANGIVRGINKVIDVLNNLQVHIPDWIPLFGGKDIGFHINHIGTVSLPRLAKGGVLYEERAFVGGEYSGARSNPEIVTPQNIMRETMEDVLSNYGGNNDRPIYLTVNVGNKKLGQILLDDLKDKKRRIGSGIEALVGG